ncbi:MAG: DUF3488 domain-containing transglutaminase family protein [Bdellovibrionaceae bacterium]|nr:DUF3488 domain-containing transglutaminase family protein [Pseudobdellovibrionaceae bacterium]
MNTWRFIFGVLICILLIGENLPLWIPILALLFVAWKGALERWRFAVPSRWFTNFLTLVALAGILLKYRTLMSQESSAGFLCLLTSLKLLEERSLRDQKFLFLLSFVLISSLLLFSVELPAIIGAFISFYLVWSSQSKVLRYRNSFFKALPLALLLFLFFPRLQNPFGLRGLNSGSEGQTGFSDELNPGSVSRIQSSKELAFRVHFLNPQLRPKTTDQYWRGQTLTISEGLRWTKSPLLKREARFQKITSPDYEVTLEPHNKRWLFTFDPTQLLFSESFVSHWRNNSYFEVAAPIRERVVYWGQVAQDAPVSLVTPTSLQTPEASFEIKSFANSLKERMKSRDGIATSLLSHFRDSQFVYSKNPGSGSDTLDSFFFKNKKGYCEHFAAATATLLRLAEVPANVVIGYQGGEYNTYGKFWRFTQADAHAWVEYLNEQNQWIRLDPTSVVAPERLELGGNLFSDLPEDWIGKNRALDFLKSRDSWWIRAKDFASLTFESLNYDIVVFLLDFNFDKQKDLIAEYRSLLFGLLGLFILIIFMKSLSRREPLSTGAWLLQEIDNKARKKKIVRFQAETLRQFIERWSKINPEFKGPLTALLQAYESEEYQVQPPRLSRRDLKKIISQLS